MGVGLLADGAPDPFSARLTTTTDTPTAETASRISNPGSTQADAARPALWAARLGREPSGSYNADA